MKRARAKEDKQRRREGFLAAAAELFAQGDYEGVTMSQVAAKAGLSKGTVYLYFRSKEALFLELLMDQLEQWFAALGPGLALVKGRPAEDFAAGFVLSLQVRPQLPRLLSLMHLVLESNLDAEQARAFKERLQQAMLPVAQQVEDTLGLARGRGMPLLLHIHALVLGLQQAAPHTDVLREVLADPALANLHVDFHPELQRAVAALVRGQERG